MKYCNFSLFTLLALLLICIPTLGSEGIFDDIELNDEVGSIDSHHSVQEDTRLPKDQTLTALTSFNAHKALSPDTEIYRHTHQPISRSPHDLPLVQYFTVAHDDNSSLYVAPFISSVWSQSFTPQSTELKSYLNLEVPNIIQIIDDYEFLDFNVLDILKLFHSIKVQEHSLGFMGRWAVTQDGWTHTISIPFTYVINNFYLTPEEQKRIAEHPKFQQFTGDIFEFTRQHCISDRIGIGDTKLSIERLLYDTYRGSWSLGVEATIPTAFAFKKGLIGTHFDAQKAAAQLDLYNDVLDPFLSNGANYTSIQEDVSIYGYAVMDRLATILLERTMGNNYHWALGGFTRSQLNFNDKFSLVSKMSLDVKLPAVNKRFFSVQATQAEFDQFDWDDNTTKIDEKMDFLNNQVQNLFFPHMYFSTVFPGITFHSTTCLKRQVDAGRWSPSIGFDTWFNSSEHFLDINAPKQILLRINEEKYRRKGAFTSAIYLAFERPAYELSPWSFSCKTYASLVNAGFGDAFGISFGFEKNF